jgi:hypothetical protein
MQKVESVQLTALRAEPMYVGYVPTAGGLTIVQVLPSHSVARTGPEKIWLCPTAMQKVVLGQLTPWRLSQGWVELSGEGTIVQALPSHFSVRVACPPVARLW